MDAACLDQVREWLAAHGIDVKHTPPMFFPETCQSVLAKHVRELEKSPEDS